MKLIIFYLKVTIANGVRNIMEVWQVHLYKYDNLFSGWFQNKKFS